MSPERGAASEPEGGRTDTSIDRDGGGEKIPTRTTHRAEKWNEKLDVVLPFRPAPSPADCGTPRGRSACSSRHARPRPGGGRGGTAGGADGVPVPRVWWGGPRVPAAPPAPVVARHAHACPPPGGGADGARRGAPPPGCRGRGGRSAGDAPVPDGSAVAHTAGGRPGAGCGVPVVPRPGGGRGPGPAGAGRPVRDRTPATGSAASRASGRTTTGAAVRRRPRKKGARRRGGGEEGGVRSTHFHGRLQNETVCNRRRRARECCRVGTYCFI